MRIYAVAVSAIANAQAKAGQEKASLETIDKLTKPGQKANGLARVVVALAQSGNVQAGLRRCRQSLGARTDITGAGAAGSIV